MKNKNLKNGLIICIVCYIVAAILYFAITEINKKYDNWIKDTGIILDIWTEYHNDGDSGYTQYWTKFEYEIDGVKYINETHGINVSYKYNNNKEETLGKEIDILIDPSDHSKSILEADNWPKKDTLVVTFGSVTLFNIIVIIFHIMLDKRNKKGRKN